MHLAELGRRAAVDERDLLAAAAEAGPVYFVCKSGGRSQKACEKLMAVGL
ncbi:MAG: hypothetical protein ACKONH_05210 [Planctomycetia bacterium]